MRVLGQTVSCCPVPGATLSLGQRCQPGAPLPRGLLHCPPMGVLPDTVRSASSCLILSGNATHPGPRHPHTPESAEPHVPTGPTSPSTPLGPLIVGNSGRTERTD